MITKQEIHKKRHTIFRVIILSCISFLISLLIYVSGITDRFELKMYDLLTGYTALKNRPEDIVIIKLDQRSLDAFEEQLGVSWPLPRQYKQRQNNNHNHKNNHPYSKYLPSFHTR